MEKTKRYDPEMIRDFLNQLSWELRRLQTRPENLLDTPNAEIGESIRALADKWHTPNLIRRDHMATPEPLRAKCLSRLNDLRAKEAEAILRALDSLEPLLDEALACIDQGDDDGLLLREISYTDFLTDEELQGWRSRPTDRKL